MFIHLLDDVISAGTAVREATGLLKAGGAELVGVCVRGRRRKATDGRRFRGPRSTRAEAPSRSARKATDGASSTSLDGRRSKPDPARF